ncbi:cell division protein FtsH, partial [Lachnotalea glycerini]
MPKKYIVALVSLLLITCFILFGIYDQNNTIIKMSYPEFLKAVEEQQVKEVTFTNNTNTFQTKLVNDNDTVYSVPNPKTENFTESLLLQNITVNYGKSGLVPMNLMILIFLVLGSGGIWYVRNRKNKSLIKNVNKTKEKNSLITLNHVAGNAEAKNMLEDVISFIKEPDKYASVGARMPKGVLLYGPPGTGKTLMAKAVAGEANVPFYAMSGSDFVQMYVGVGASRIRSLRQKAKKSEKADRHTEEKDATG